MVEIIRDVSEMARRAGVLGREGTGPALVPTMGCLHEGHLSLIRLARSLRPMVVVSIFVNPTQFAPGEDFERYPRALENDCRQVEGAGGRIVFAPTADGMYPPGFQSHVEVDDLTRSLCGPRRPGHFRGVATVVLKLLNIVRPEVAVFGEKDWQQLAVIRRLVRDLNVPVEIVGHPLVREADGLALSSRNAYLSPEERRRALCLYRALQAGRETVRAGEREAQRVRRVMRRIVEETPGTSIEYVAAADPETLAELDRISGPVLLALAVRVGATRLIDNLLVGPGKV